MKKFFTNPTHLLRSVLLLSLLCATAFLAIASPVSAKNSEKVVITLFWGEGCPHCATEKSFLATLKEKYPNLEVRTYEVWYIEPNIPIMEKMAKAYGFEVSGVPITFLGDKNWVGFSDGLKIEIEELVKTCSTKACKDSAQDVLTQEELAAGVPLSAESEEANSVAEETQSQSASEPQNASTIDVPLIGKVDLEKQSLAIATLLIGFVDGVNPCSIWALSMLLAITLHTGSRKKVMLIGLVFISVTALVYALFILGMFSALTLLSSMGWIQVVVSLVALFFAIINIKDYFWYKEGISFTIADDKKPGLFQKMRRVVDASDSFWGLVGATVVLAGGVSLVEFACTAGFPVIWTNLVSAQQVAPLTFGLLLLLYILIYQLDELAIFSVAVVTLKSSKIEEKHGRILKLIGGTLMLALAVAMLVDPFVMNSLSKSMAVFGMALAITLLVLLIHRLILPAMGVFIGTEMNPQRRLQRRPHRRR